MNVRQLEAFKSIMELGSFTRAAEKLNLTQPAVSKLIVLLERKCGFKLFIRQQNGVVPTVEGEMLYAEVERVFLGLESVSARAEAIRKFDYGKIDIVTFPSFGTRVLPSILAEFIKDRQLTINLSSRNSRLLVDRIATQGVDVGFGMARSERPGVISELLCSMQAVCVLHPDHPLAGRSFISAPDLEGERFISLADEDGVQIDIDRVFAERGIRRDIVLKSQLTEAVCSFVAEGLGIAIVDPLSTVGFGRHELAVKRFEPQIRQDIWVMTPSFRQTSLTTQSLVKHVRKALAIRLDEITSSLV
ncbi:LysR substrate-binding domain-containing protein [Neorhizobium alkalisoli]|uniref:HTH-type transcriptional regulator TtuA n=1 Tax=Neorhizobium alkalisoli TaxID=528178 RepID=A0A561Q136_9HYPH|nr:LysR substrate-binding domain-containing protein [Neorhizobium alkalisoli]TWF44082.1 LysR family transcriptional regulator [Neorhizobium alkalisoli]